MTGDNPIPCIDLCFLPHLHIFHLGFDNFEHCLEPAGFNDLGESRAGSNPLSRLKSFKIADLAKDSCDASPNTQRGYLLTLAREQGTRAFGILILILLYKPSGLFGSRLQIEAGR